MDVITYPLALEKLYMEDKVLLFWWAIEHVWSQIASIYTVVESIDIFLMDSR